MGVPQPLLSHLTVPPISLAHAVRPLRLRVLALLLAVVLLALHHGIARAEAIAEYEANNAALEQLVVQRQDTAARLFAAIASEQAALARLTAAETKLNALLSRQAEFVALQPALTEQASDLEAQIAAAAEAQARHETRLAAQEVWLFGTEAPQALSMRGYAQATASLEAVVAARDAAQAQLDETRAAQATAVDRLGAANTEITWWEGEAAALSGQVGSARSRALLASALLAQLQPTGDLLAAEVQAQFQALSSAGHPINVATIADGLMPITEPAPWPAVPPPVYVLPGGHMAASLLTGAPLLVDQQGLLDTHALDGIPEWTTPVSGPITTPYGDATPYQAAHWAIDLGTRLYAPVVAAADGVVEYAGLAASTNRLASYGLVVLIRHNERVTTLYAHLDDRAHGLAVSAGDAVQKGQVIGYVGLTGYSTGPHLHFEVRVDHRSIDPLLLVSP